MRWHFFIFDCYWQFQLRLIILSTMVIFYLLQSNYFFWITSLTIHHTNAFSEFSMAFFFINNYHKIFLTISFFINDSDISLSILFNLLLANIIIFYFFFFLFRDVLNNFLTIPVEIQNSWLKLALAVPTGASITIANDAIEIMPLVTDEKFKDLPK